MKSPTVHDLRKRGIKVRVSHWRSYSKKDPHTGEVANCIVLQRLQPTGFLLEAKGGLTEVMITDKDGNHYTGLARCSPADHYVLRQGLNRALGRALQGYLANNTL